MLAPLAKPAPLGALLKRPELAKANLAKRKGNIMSIVILGGNECMERRYKDLCQSYNCQAKVYTKPSGGLKNKLGNPDLTIFFTNTMSHKMVHGALSELKSSGTIIERCHTSSLSALRGILEKHAG